MLDKKVLFIGGGNMAEGIIRGQIKSDAIKKENIYVYEILESRSKYLKDEFGIQIVSSLKEALQTADIVFIAVRPQNAIEVLAQVKEAGNTKALILSICAGITLTTMVETLSSEYRIARIMPNVLIEAQHGYSGVCINPMVTGEDKSDIEYLLKALGQTMFIDEVLFNEFTAFSCAGPAYIFSFITAMIDAGVHSGFSRDDARNIVLANMIGSAKMVELTGKHPYEIIDTMTSPAGVTIEGIKTLNEKGFQGIVMNCVHDAVKKAQDLS